MNKAPLDYAMTRVNGILAAKINQITEQHTKPAQHIDDHQRAELVRSGKVKLRSDISSISTYDDVSKVFDFSKFSWASAIDHKAVEKAAKPFRTQAEKLKDKIMLGDENTAMAALEAFSAKCGITG